MFGFFSFEIILRSSKQSKGSHIFFHCEVGFNFLSFLRNFSIFFLIFSVHNVRKQVSNSTYLVYYFWVNTSVLSEILEQKSAKIVWWFWKVIIFLWERKKKMVVKILNMCPWRYKVRHMAHFVPSSPFAKFVSETQLFVYFFDAENFQSFVLILQKRKGLYLSVVNHVDKIMITKMQLL